MFVVRIRVECIPDPAPLADLWANEYPVVLTERECARYSFNATPRTHRWVEENVFPEEENPRG